MGLSIGMGQSSMSVIIKASFLISIVIYGFASCISLREQYDYTSDTNRVLYERESSAGKTYTLFDTGLLQSEDCYQVGFTGKSTILVSSRNRRLYFLCPTEPPPNPFPVGYIIKKNLLQLIVMDFEGKLIGRSFVPGRTRMDIFNTASMAISPDQKTLLIVSMNEDMREKDGTPRMQMSLYDQDGNHKISQKIQDVFSETGTLAFLNNETYIYTSRNSGVYNLKGQVKTKFLNDNKNRFSGAQRTPDFRLYGLYLSPARDQILLRHNSSFRESTAPDDRRGNSDYYIYSLKSGKIILIKEDYGHLKKDLIGRDIANRFHLSRYIVSEDTGRGLNNRFRYTVKNRGNKELLNFSGMGVSPYFEWEQIVFSKNQEYLMDCSGSDLYLWKFHNDNRARPVLQLVYDSTGNRNTNTMKSSNNSIAIDTNITACGFSEDDKYIYAKGFTSQIFLFQLDQLKI